MRIFSFIFLALAAFVVEANVPGGLRRHRRVLSASDLSDIVADIAEPIKRRNLGLPTSDRANYLVEPPGIGEPEMKTHLTTSDAKVIETETVDEVMGRTDMSMSMSMDMSMDMSMSMSMRM